MFIFYSFHYYTQSSTYHISFALFGITFEVNFICNSFLLVTILFMTSYLCLFIFLFIILLSSIYYHHKVIVGLIAHGGILMYVIIERLMIFIFITCLSFIFGCLVIISFYYSLYCPYSLSHHSSYWHYCNVHNLSYL